LIKEMYGKGLPAVVECMRRQENGHGQKFNHDYGEEKMPRKALPVNVNPDLIEWARKRKR